MEVYMQFPPQMDRGQGLVEYAMIIVFVAIIVLIILFLLGPAVGNLYSSILDIF